MQVEMKKCFLLNLEKNFALVYQSCRLRKNALQLRKNDLRFGDVIFLGVGSVSELSGFCVFLENDQMDLCQIFFRV